MQAWHGVSQQPDCGAWVRTFRARACTLVAATIAAFGCGTLPVPQVAVEGSTAMVLLPGAYPVGYGRALAGYPDPATHPLSGAGGAATIPGYGSSGRPEDPQRGELLFELLDDQQQQITPNRVFLPLRYITRVNPRPETPGMTGGLSPAYVDGQVVAILDVPLGSVAATGDYFVEVHRYRRIEGDEDNFAKLDVFTSSSVDFRGWGAGYSSSSSSGTGTGSGPIPLRILNSPDEVDRTTPKAGWTDFLPYSPLAWSDFEDDIDDLIPYPVAWVSAVEISPPGMPPAAWQVDLTYPRSRIAIRSVTSRNTTPGNAIVTWDDGGDPGTVTCSTASQTLTIRVVDPNRTTRSVNVAFELEDTYEDPSCGARAQASDFEVVSGTFKGYDEDGVESTSSWSLDVQSDSPAFR